MRSRKSTTYRLIAICIKAVFALSTACTSSLTSRNDNKQSVANIQQAIGPTLIAIAGASGSGKSTLAANLKSALSKENYRVDTFTLDDYYRSSNDEFFNGETNPQFINYEHLESVHWDIVSNDLTDVKAGKNITLPGFDIKTTKFVPKGGEPFNAEKLDIVIVDHLHALTKPEIRKLFDISISIDLPYAVATQRRQQRIAGQSNAANKDWIKYDQDFLAPSFRENIEPYLKKADIYLQIDKDIDSGSIAKIATTAVLNKIQKAN